MRWPQHLLQSQSFVHERLIAHVIDFEVERDEYCRSILQLRQSEGFLDPAPVYADINEYCPSGKEVLATGVAGGFPCQEPLQV